MSLWLVLILGIIVGWIIGVFIVRMNHENCKKQVALLKQQISEKDEQIQEAEHAIEDLTHEIKASQD
jgi:uncharacterized membrane-anchored protein YhcB (DUF1043 family)